ncbi:MAG: hypothetical protein ACRENI_00735 [Gemmatimonadaceae bacterium]
MINHIDLGSVLRHSVCEVYTDLVTRPTGAAVRTQIEHQLADSLGEAVTIIDFTHVGLLDFSCADEVVAKLLLQHRASGSSIYFLLRGVSESHLDAIEAVLERHDLALVVQLDDGAAVVAGPLAEGERRLWETMYRLGHASAAQAASAAALEPAEAASALADLCRRRLVMRLQDGYVTVGTRE